MNSYSDLVLLWLDGVETGPFTTSDVWLMVNDGKVPRTVLAREFSSSGNWVPFCELALGARAFAVEPPILTGPGAGQNRRRSGSPSGFGMALFAVLAFLTLILAFGRLAQAPREWPEASPRKAYRAAVEFVNSRLPGAQKFSSFDQAQISRDGSTWFVGFIVDGVNAFGGPVRRPVVVQMNCDGSEFSFVALKQ